LTLSDNWVNAKPREENLMVATIEGLESENFDPLLQRSRRERHSQARTVNEKLCVLVCKENFASAYNEMEES
jgi:hypothetical protein